MPAQTRSAATRQAVLEAARDRFAELGFEATSMLAIARHAGLTTGAVTHHYGSKAELFQAVLAAVEDEHLRHVRTALAAVPAGPEKLVACCRAHIEYMARADYRQIALMDAPAVVGVRARSAITDALGTTPLELVLRELLAGQPAQRPMAALTTLILGALAGAADVTGDGVLTIDDFVDAISVVVADVARTIPSGRD